MKFSKTTIGWLIAAFFWSIFMGVTAISIGVGALYPPLNYIAKPLACPNGQLNFEQHVSNPIPGTTQTTATWVCTDPQSGSQTEIGPIKMGVYAGTFYGLLLFVVGCFVWYMNVRWGSDPIIGKILHRVQIGIGILILVIIIAFPMLPLFKEVIREFGPSATQTSLPTAIHSIPAPTGSATLQPATSAPLIESIDHAKAVRSSNGPSLANMAQELYPPTDFANPGTRTYIVLMPVAVPTVQWEYGWCATTSKILATDIRSIELKFVMDGHTVPLSDFAVDDSPAPSGEQCHTLYVVLSHWPVGVHHLTTTATFTSKINDGNSDYPAGDYVQDYTVKVRP